MTKSRVYNFWSSNFFSWGCEGLSLSLSLCRLSIYINFIYHSVVLCMYIPSSSGFTSWFVIVQLPTSFEAWFCPWWLWGFLLGQCSKYFGLLTSEMTLCTQLLLVSFRVSQVHIGVKSNFHMNIKFDLGLYSYNSFIVLVIIIISFE